MKIDPGHWFVQLFISLDQLANVLITPLSGGAWADETLSCRAYRMWRDGKPWGRLMMPVIDFLFAWQSLPEGAIGHCHGAFIKERQKYNHPPEMR